MKKILIIFIALFSTFSVINAKLNYEVEDGWIVGHNVGYYNNRPIYLHNTNAFILCGDKPLCRFAKDDALYGNFFIAYLDNGTEIPLYDFDNIKSMYRAGKMIWLIKDSRFPKMEVKIEVLSHPQYLGGSIMVSSKGVSAGCKLIWESGENNIINGERMSWKYDVMGHPELLKWGIDDNFAASQKGEVKANGVSYISVKMNDDKKISIIPSSKKEFNTALSKNSILESRVSVNTPDEYLNAVAESSVSAVDGTWYPPVFVHGCMQWNNALPGWRTIFGGTMYGWHERVREEAKYYIESQVKNSDKTEAKADTALLLTGQAQDSRFYGVGRILKDQSFYDMQSQFFDQIIEDYRWTNNPELVKILRPALELHLIWMQECFDPDGDGLYESYMNTWPTDSQWYNGGGSAEATSYAYRGHKAALDMAYNAKDDSAVSYHKKMLEKIKKGFFDYLWIKERGHSGAYKEQGGYERVHKDPWLYSIFLPVDAGLTSPLQSIESVYYSQWALQNDKMESGGRRVWTSNWVPGAWSVRELWPGDNYHLALSYFQAGFPNDGWDILRGTFMHSAFNHTVPGNLGSDQGGVDFGDCVHTFARSLVSGLFGYNPDYPKGEVVIRPSLPTDWKYGSIEIPDYKFYFNDANNKSSYKIKLASAARMKLYLPVQCRKVNSVLVNGKKVVYEVLPAPGRSLVAVYTDKCTDADIVISYDGGLPYFSDLNIEKEILGDGAMSFEQADEIVALYDPQQIFKEYETKGNSVRYRLSGKSGYHTVVAKVKCGDNEQLRVARINLTDNESKELEAKKNMQGINLAGDWMPVNISSYYNADVRTIYKQKYLSPRPNTVSVRIGSDGFSPWTFPYWRTKAPEIKLDKVSSFLKDSLIIVSHDIPFYWNSLDRNIAFVSLWDNYPNTLSFPMNNRMGEAVCFLVCGSTNMMHCNIENATISIVYEDGEIDVISLIPPVNYWNLCPIDSHASAPGQFSRSYYTSEVDKFCLPEVLPETVELGENCKAMLLARRLKKGVGIEKIELNCMSQEVVVGMVGISIKN